VREKKFNKAEYRKIQSDVTADLVDVDICQITPEVLVSIITLLESHPLRSMDAIHVACALNVKPDVFMSVDHRQLASARKARLKIVDVS
jgi:uncharacterized protein